MQGLRRIVDNPVSIGIALIWRCFIIESMSESFDWNEWFDPEAIESERFDADLEMDELEHGDYGGVDDGFGNIISDADPGL